MADAKRSPTTIDRPAATPARSFEVRRIQSSYLQVAEQVRDLILRGDLVAGQRLPSEAEMAPLFGVSRSTIREALRILVTDGLLVTRRGVHGGTFVAELDPMHIAGVLDTAFNILAVTNQVGAADFLEAWRAIEAPAARLAARRRGGDVGEQLRDMSALLPASAPRAARLQQATDFHFALLSASGNLLLEAMGRPVSAVARARFAQTAPSEEFWRTNTEEHRRIYEAIIVGDEDRAEAEAVRHVEGRRSYYGLEGS